MLPSNFLALSKQLGGPSPDLLTAALSEPPVNLKQLLKDLCPDSLRLKGLIVVEASPCQQRTRPWAGWEAGPAEARLYSQQPPRLLSRATVPVLGTPAAANFLPRSPSVPQPPTHPTLYSAPHKQGPLDVNPTPAASPSPNTPSPPPHLHFQSPSPVDSASLSSAFLHPHIQGPRTTSHQTYLWREAGAEGKGPSSRPLWLSRL